MDYLSIGPVCLRIGTHSLYISREAMTQVAQLKQNPALLAHLLLPSVCDAPAVTGDAMGKEASDGH